MKQSITNNKSLLYNQEFNYNILFHSLELVTTMNGCGVLWGELNINTKYLILVANKTSYTSHTCT